MSEIVTRLEMTSPLQLVQGSPPPAPVQLQEVGAGSAHLVRSIYVRIWEPLVAAGRMTWSDDRWREELSRPGVYSWVARVGDEAAGFVELEGDANGDVGIVVFGLVPEFQGRRFGGSFLALATETAWRIGSLAGGPTQRVWLQTSSGDHPHALANYERRGFRAFESRAGH
ncbi:GNAT family N-acetyltransferase [Pseudonocardia sp.]|uniref:GNAT family N-acetyltransferase n=1 Tax=Pseudonocardia sp. TaxID=60912 RepID=UPI0031FBFC76